MYFVIGILLLAIDQYSKYLVRTEMEVFESIPLIPNFFHLTYVQNRGAAFGAFQGGSKAFALITFLILSAVLYFFWKNPHLTASWKMTLILITSGAVGNLIDRLWLGYVVDMLDFRGIWSYIFNFADICVVLGGIVLGILVLKDDKVLENSK